MMVVAYNYNGTKKFQFLNYIADLKCIALLRCIDTISCCVGVQ
jgi:hypothetical protein